jgi:hypothetical protein
VAEKNDQFLVARLLAAGVEFGVIKASFTSSLANICLTALALWLPLMPLFFIMRRMLDSRGGMGKKKRATTVSTPPVTFADVAGEGARRAAARPPPASARARARSSAPRLGPCTSHPTHRHPMTPPARPPALPPLPCRLRRRQGGAGGGGGVPAQQ